MNRQTGKIVVKIMEEIERYEDYLDCLKGIHKYENRTNQNLSATEFEVHYSNNKVFVLEYDALANVLVDYYVNKLKKLNKKLEDI